MGRGLASRILVRPFCLSCDSCHSGHAWPRRICHGVMSLHVQASMICKDSHKLIWINQDMDGYMRFPKWFRESWMRRRCGWRNILAWSQEHQLITVYRLDFRFGEDCFSADIILETAARSTRHPSSPPLSPPNSHTRHEAMLPYHRCMPKCFFLFRSSYPKKGVGMPGGFAVRFPPSVIAMLRSSMTYFLRSNTPYRIPNSKWCCGGSVGILSHLSYNLLLQLICSLIFPQYLVTRRRGWSSPFPDILETGDRYDF